MRIFSLISLFTLGLYYAGFAQVDVLTARADPKTFIFDDDKHTVHGYIYAQLKEITSCCGNDAVYLEVKFDESGTVTSAKTLTGRNDCYKQSVIDIVGSVRWNAQDVKGSKTIYFEVKPIIPCSGSPGENVYRTVARVGGASIASTSKPEEKSTEVAVAEVKKEPEVKKVETVIEVPVKQPEPVKEVVAVVKEDDGFLSDESSLEVKAPVAETKVTTPPANDPKKVTVISRSESEEPVQSKPAVASKPAKVSGGKIPPQAKLEYVSTGEHNPDPSHKETWANSPVGHVTNPEISDQSQFGAQMRSNLRNAGFCGLAQALVEVEIDRNGNVVGSRVMYANEDKVREILPNLVRSMKFKSPESNPKTIFSYYEVKTEIVCQGGKPKYNLEQVPDVLKASAQ